MGLTVSELAELSGVATDTVRHWERAGLLPTPDRKANGYRNYQPQVTERIRFIRGAQRAGLRLREIRDLLEIRDRGACPCGHSQHVLTARIDEINSELARLTALRHELGLLLDANHPCIISNNPTWPCEDHLISLGGGDNR